MDKIVGVVSKAPQTRTQNDDDFADRLSSRYTVVLLVVFAVLVSMNQVSYTQFLADRTVTQYDRLLPAACCPSVCLSVCL